MAKHIEVLVDKCTGCKMCELACSAVKVGHFNPKDSRIKVVLVDIPEIPVPFLTDACDYCFGNPTCVSVCVPKALVWKDMETRPPRPNIAEAKTIAHAWLESVSR